MYRLRRRNALAYPTFSRLPKMGVTSVTRTSTPKTDLASPKSPKFRVPESPKSPNVKRPDFANRTSGLFDYDNDGNGNDEPIYCEIATPGKSPKRIPSNFDSPSPKSSNLVRNNYLRHSAGLPNVSEKPPNFVAMNYRRQTSANPENNFRNQNSVRTDFPANIASRDQFYRSFLQLTESFE